MDKESLIKMIKERSKLNEDVLVSIDEFFENRDYRWSFASNVCSESIDSMSFYILFKELSTNKDVKDIKILIEEIDDCGEGPYADTLYLITKMSETKIIEYFGEIAPNEITVVEKSEEISRCLERAKGEFKVLCLWWD